MNHFDKHVVAPTIKDITALLVVVLFGVSAWKLAAYAEISFQIGRLV